MTRFVITEQVETGVAASPPSTGYTIEARRATVSATATGALYKLARLLGNASTLALIAGSNANLKLDGSTGVISATAAIGAGVSQMAIIREALGDLALEYPVTLIGAANALPSNVLTLADQPLTLAATYLTLGNR